MMKRVFAAFICLSLITPSYGQQTEAYSWNYRTLIEYSRNPIKIQPANDSLDLQVEVSNGSIRPSVSSKWIHKSGEFLMTKDSIFLWDICQGSQGFEYLYAKYIFEDSVIYTDTLKFNSLKAPILLIKAYRLEDQNDPESSKKVDGVTTKNVSGVRTVTEHDTKLQDYKIIGFRIHLIKKNKIRKTLYNKGSVLSPENLETLSGLKKFCVQIHDIEIRSVCDANLQHASIQPICVN